MAQNMLNKRIEEINNLVSDLLKEKQTLQRDCIHENIIYEYKGNIGNYDQACDIFWVDLHCKDCGLRWKMDQDKLFFNMKRNNKKWEQKGE